MIRVVREGPLATITLARPEKRNALTPEMLASLASAVAQADATDARVIVLAGEGPSFCAGFDLTLCKDHHDGAVMRALLTGLSDAIEALRAQPRPVVVAAHGTAVAGGCALLGAADLVLTNDDAKLGYPVVKLGVSPAVSGPFLRLRVGDAPARERMLDTALISGRHAAAIGLASRSLPTPDEVLPAALAEARTLADKAPAALAATRRLLAEIENLADSPWRALSTSLSLTGGEEERRLLPQVWSPR
jgi:methylglutaconyl-CoA hydratase